MSAPSLPSSTTNEPLIPEPDVATPQDALIPDGETLTEAIVPASGWPGPRFASRISASQRGLCLIQPDRSVVCLGDGSSPRAPVGEVQQVSLGFRDVCGLLRDGTIACSADGQVQPTVPAGVFANVQVDDNWACALSQDGLGSCWGEPDELASLDIPQVPFSQISVRLSTGCGVARSGEVLCWGHNSASTLFASRVVPDRTDYAAVYIGSDTCGLFGQGEVGCWNEFAEPPAGLGYVMVSSGPSLLCALHVDGFVRCTGSAVEEWQGDEDFIPMPNVVLHEIAVVDGWGCGVSEDNLLHCWGSDVPAGFVPSPEVISLEDQADTDPCDDDASYVPVEAAATANTDTISGSIEDDPQMPTCLGYEGGFSIFKLQGHLYGHPVEVASQSSSQLAGGWYKASGLEVQAVGDPTEQSSALESGTLVLRDGALAGTLFRITSGELMTTTLPDGVSVSFRISGIRQDKGDICPTPDLPVALRGCQFRGQ